MHSPYASLCVFRFLSNASSMGSRQERHRVLLPNHSHNMRQMLRYSLCRRRGVFVLEVPRNPTVFALLRSKKWLFAHFAHCECKLRCDPRSGLRLFSSSYRPSFSAPATGLQAAEPEREATRDAEDICGSGCPRTWPHSPELVTAQTWAGCIPHPS